MHKPDSRFVSILAGALVLLAGVTCTDSPTGPRSGRGGNALVGFAPSFSQAAADIYRSLANFQLEVDNIHVRLEHENGETAKDTVVVLAAGEDSVVIELSVTLNGSTELLDALIELRDGSTVLFSGTQDINARAGSFPATSPPVELDYTGPGAAATLLSVSPVDTAIQNTGSLTYQASAKDKDGNAVTDIVVAWSLTNPARGTIDANGVFTPATGRGTTDVIARLPNAVQATAHLQVVPPPVKAVVISGDAQTGIAGKVLPQPIVVEIRAADDLPVPFAQVTVQVTGGGGSLVPTAGVADANGRLSLALTLGTVAGPNAVQVAGESITPLDLSATGAPDMVAKVVLSQQPSTTVIPNVVFPTQPKVQLQDANGNAVALANIPITAALTDPAGRTLVGTLTVNTNDAGVAEFTGLKITGPVGSTTLTFTAGEVTSATSSSMTLAIGPPIALVIVSGDGQGSLPSQTLANPLVLKVMDEGNNPVQTTNVTFSVTSGGGTLSGGSPSVVIASDGSGNASTSWNVGSGMQKVTATMGGVTLELRAFILEKLVIATQPALSPQSNVPFTPQPVVRLADTEGNFVKLAGIQVLADGEAVAPFFDAVFDESGNNIATTDANGVATFANLAVLGDIEQHGHLLFYRLVGEVVDETIVPGTSAEITMLPGIPQQLVAEDFVEYHRMPTPVSTKTLTIVASDGYNEVPNWPIAFGVVSGPLNCSITTPTTVNTDALGKASVNVATLAPMSSCAVRAQPVFPPPPPCPECPPATAPPPPQVSHKLYVAPDDVKIWTGQTNSSFPGPASNWFNGDAPDGTTAAFIPVASQFASGNTPTNGGTTQLLALTVESGATFNMGGEPLHVSGDLISNGEIVGGGDLVLKANDAITHSLNGIVHAKIIVGDSLCLGARVIVGTLTADEIQLKCQLHMIENFNVSVEGHLRLPGINGYFLQTKGVLTVGGNLTVDNGTAVFSGGSATVNGELIVSSNAHLNQTAGSILVGGDATFDGFEDLSDGVLELKKSFTHTGDCSTSAFFADAPHTLRFTGGDPDAQLHLIWQPCEDRIGILEVATSGQGLAVFSGLSPESINLRSILVKKGAILEIKDDMSVSGDPDVGSIVIEALGLLKLFSPTLPNVGCPDDNIFLTPGSYNGPISCTFKP